jgi:hypothetical protein
MRESRLSGSEGGVPGNGHPYPYQKTPIDSLSNCSDWGEVHHSLRWRH